MVTIRHLRAEQADHVCVCEQADHVCVCEQWWVELIVDIYFISDIAINFRTAFRDVNNFLVQDLKEIRRKYLMSWFIVDIMSTLPVSYVQLIAVRPARPSHNTEIMT